MLICRGCNIEIDTSSGYPEHELMSHYDNLHDKVIERFLRCMQSKFNGYHFVHQFKNTARVFIEHKHNFIDYSVINNDNNKDKDELNEVLNFLKDNIILD